MKVYFNRSYVNKPWGGGNAFAKAIKDVLPTLGTEIIQPTFTDRPDVICLLAIDGDQEHNHIGAEQAVFYKKMQAKAGNDVKLVLRVNENDARKATTHVDPALLKLSQYLDGTVFVSAWLQDYFNEKGWACSNQTVIHNGCDNQLFHPYEKLNNGLTNIVTAHWSDNKMKGEATHVWLDEFVGKHPEKFTYTFVGRTKAKLKNSKHITPIQGETLAKEIGSRDVCINATLFDPGPNSVIEPISCGLPTYVHKDGGGAVEFAGKSHVFSSHEDLEKLLLAGEFTQNSYAPDTWDVTMASLKRYLESI